MRPVYVAGVGLHPFGRFAEKSLTALGTHAVRAALADAGVGRGGFGAAFCGSVYGGVAAGHKVLTALGLSGVPIVNVEAGCASGGAALALGATAVASGRHDVVLVFGLEKMPRGIIRSSFFEPWREEAGLAATPAYFALRAQRLMLESDVRLEDLARVSANNHRHGVANPYAMYRRALSVEEILASPVVCEPLRLLMLCAPNEGAAAVVLSAGPTPVRVAAAALRSHHAGSVLGEHTPLSGLADDGVPTPTEMAAADAYAEAGLGPGDLHLVELQDTDAAREILSAEELGLCAKRGGGRWVRDGGGEMASRLPVNPSGGLLSKGEPLGASALGQIVELTWQLRGAAGPRQVPGAQVALAHTVGRGANACVIILATRDHVSGRGRTARVPPGE
ncbi:MAG: acetyl-CoA acetyltransferase [Candidatus Rokuibacteriota bacterium]|nr:MAG: acetyl-CoA acetyltransferase [Candidatus Rokubacteria bacterium]